MKSTMSELEWAMWILTLVGAINWGLVGLVKFDLVQTVFGTTPWLASLIYIVIGLSGLYWAGKAIRAKK